MTKSPESKPISGIACPKCGGIEWGVLSTRRRPGRLVRVRKCEGCEHVVRTREQIEATQATRAQARPQGGTD